MDIMPIGSAPWDEPCMQVETGKDYLPAMKKECERFRDLLEQAFPPPDGAYLTITSNPHDFGTYLEVAVRYDEHDREAVDYALMLEGHAPGTWRELKILANK